MNAPAFRLPWHNGQIEIDSLREDGFALAGRPYAAWRRAGEGSFQEGVAERLEATWQSEGQLGFRGAVGPLRLELLAAGDETGGQFAGRVQNSGDHAVEVARLHYLHGETPPGVGLVAVNKGTDMATWIGRDAGLKAPNERVAEATAKVHVSRPVLSEPIGDGAGWCLAEDIGLLTQGWDRPGWVIGATGPGTAFGQVGLSTGGSGAFAAAGTFFAGVWLEGIRLEPGETRQLETLRVTFGDWQDGIRAWSYHAALAMGRRGPAASPAGFCSWYQWGHGIDQPTFERAIDEYAALPTPPGGRLVQLDDGYQKMPGDWGATIGSPSSTLCPSASPRPARSPASGSPPPCCTNRTRLSASTPTGSSVSPTARRA